MSEKTDLLLVSKLGSDLEADTNIMKICRLLIMQTHERQLQALLADTHTKGALANETKRHFYLNKPLLKSLLLYLLYIARTSQDVVVH